MDDVLVVSLEGDADDVAEQLLRPHLPRQRLDQVVVGEGVKGMGDLFAHLMLRPGRASIERDELIAFVERNRRRWTPKTMEILDKVCEAACATDEEFGHFMDYFITNLRLAVTGNFAHMDMRSDKLFWLIYALSHQLESCKIRYAQARAKLNRDEVRTRISRHQLAYMLHDFAEGMESPHEPSITMLMLILECALIGDHVDAVQAAAGILARFSLRAHVTDAIDVLSRASARLSTAHRLESRIEECVRRLNAMQARVRDDDF